MAVNNFEKTTFPLSIPLRGELKSDDLNAFSEAVTADMEALSTLLNNNVVNLLNTLPDSTESLDGTNIYVDKNSTNIKDYGIFYHNDASTPANNRPKTLYEILLFFFQVVANVKNGMREGVKIASLGTPFAHANSATQSYDWPYTDAAFEPLLFTVSGTTVSPINLTDWSITVDTSASPNQLEITNNSGGSLDVFGYVWHPVLSIQG